MRKAIATPAGEPTQHVELTPLEEAKIEAEWRAAEQEKEANRWIGNRMNEYGTAQEQLDMIYDDAMEGTTKWRDHITAIKAKYPKPNR